MKILHIARTVTAYAPARFVHLINKYTQHEAKLCQIKDFFLGNPHNVQLIKGAVALDEALEWADVLHFHGTHFYERRVCKCGPGKGRVRIKKYLKKPHCLHYHGSPHREYPNRYMIGSCKILLSTPEMLSIFKPLRMVYFPNLIDETSEIYKKREIKHAGNPSICHHYSMHKSKKDTNIYEKTSNYFANNGQELNCKMLPVMKLQDALIERATHDIVFDHLQGYYGLISIEGMAQGLCVVNGASLDTMRSLSAFFGAEPPFMITNKNKIINDLKALTIEQINEYGQKGIDFMKTYWSGAKNIHRLIDFYGTL